MPDHPDLPPSGDASRPDDAPPPPGGQPPGAAAQPPAAPQAPRSPQAPAPPRAPAPPQAPQAPAVASGVGQPADLTTRFLARLIDYVLLIVVNIVLVGAIIIGAILGMATGGFGGGGGFVGNTVSAILGAAIYLGYFAFLESSRGQTVGKMLMKLETRGPDGHKPTMEQAIKRNAWTALGIISIIPIVGWLLAPLVQLGVAVFIAVTINGNTATRQGWHDTFADGTSVIKIG